MKRLLLATLFVCLSLQQFGCTQGNETRTEAAREPERLSDSDLQKMVDTHIKSDPDLRDVDIDVDADADRKQITLSGTVTTEALRTRVVQLTKRAHPDLVIVDKIDVKPRAISRSEYTPEMASKEVEMARSRKERVGSGIDDAWIHSKIIAQFLTDKDTPTRNINVDVERGVVTLRGTVEEMVQKQEAERIAKETDGVKRVNNMLKVSKT